MSLIEKLVEMDGSTEEIVSNLQKKYSNFAKKGDIFELNKLVNQIKVEPELSDKELYTLYISSAKGYVSSHNFKKIKEWDSNAHNGKTEVFNGLGDDFAEALQEGYGEVIADDYNIEKKYFEELRNITGINIAEETIQNAINKKIKQKNVLGNYYFKNVEQATGISPKPNEKIVQNLYKDCLRKERIGGQHLYFWEYIAESTKIMPEEKTAQSAFRYFVNMNSVSSLIRFAEFTGIIPKKEIVEDAYRVSAKKGSFTNYYKELKKISNGIEPDEDTIQLAYKKAVKGKSMWDFYFKKIKELTEINPRETLVHQAYSKCINKGQFDDFEKLYDTFKVKPSEDVRKTLANYLSS